ncbi:S-adenosyl-L-methionine-dependent methyltransferase [Patellaria atrata CBS 101060]|uniref:S-adenosyl-L-methionine-dependent methyltransferase n=1 Tax=Patellaria atrata CBS 101060 TaxID=1346257 RepID=A0A9P4SGC6_9PEZI|nr:S-adenosyl-L-methionine-dependent methyltransferase [Patellaria atrata CBS 101060]
MAEALDQPSEARERLRQHFLGHEPSEQTSQWDALWKAGDFLPWDRGGPNPALIDILNDRRDLIGDPEIDAAQDSDSQKRKRALVPGCGKGYDVLLLASFGYDAVGLDVSESALEVCRKYAASDEIAGKYPVRDPALGKGDVKFVLGDFFKDNWVDEANEDWAVGNWDLIYDYTFLSALPPSLRPAWSGRMSDLLAANGILICLEFPTYKPPSTGGPPWALPPTVYLQHLSRPGEKIEYDEEGYVVESDKTNQMALKRIAHWQPERTHDVGKGTDWVSVWKHQQ